MENSNDRRVRKTKKALTDALIKLMEEKPLNQISVREITELADINRGTFYLHYHDVFDMARKLHKEIIDSFHDIVERHDTKNEVVELFPMLTELFELIAKESDLVRLFIGKNGDITFIEQIEIELKEHCFSKLQNHFNINSGPDFDHYFQFIISGCVGICTSWLNNGMKESPKEMASFIEKIIISSMGAIKNSERRL